MSVYNWQAEIHMNVYQLNEDGVGEEAADEGDVGAGGPGEEISACSIWTLPAREFDGLWDRCVFSFSVCI